MTRVARAASPATGITSHHIGALRRNGVFMPTLSQPESLDDARRRREDRRVRPTDQEVLLTARMSRSRREFVKELAHRRGMSVADYLLTLAENDARSVSLFGSGDAATLSGDNSTKAEGPRRVDEVPHAKAGHAVTAAAG